MSRPVTNARLLGDPMGDKSRRRMHKTQALVNKSFDVAEKSRMSPEEAEAIRRRAHRGQRQFHERLDRV